MGFVEPATPEVVVQPLDHRTAKCKLCTFVKRAAKAPIIRRRLLGNGAHHGHQFGTKLIK